MLKLEPGDCDVSSVAQETVRGSRVITSASQRDLDQSQASLVKLPLVIVTVCRHYGILRRLTFLVRATDRCANDLRQGNQHYDRVPQDPFQREHAHSFLLQFVYALRRWLQHTNIARKFTSSKDDGAVESEVRHATRATSEAALRILANFVTVPGTGSSPPRI
jgi:hypothetical protein